MALPFTIPNRPFHQFASFARPASGFCPSFLASPSSRFCSSPSASASPSCFATYSAWFGQTLGIRHIACPIPPLRPLRMAGSASATAVTDKSLHDFTVKDINGKDVNLSDYRGKVLLIVNVASKCGLTNSNYTELAELYNKYTGQDFEVLAFPCNQFGGQEPGTNEQIKEFACTRFKAEYPIFDKVEVNGPNTAPVYKFLKSSKGGFLAGLLGDNIKWNFEKFLVDKNGQVAHRYAPTTSPSKIQKDIEVLIAA